MAQDFLAGLLQGVAPPIQKAIETRAKQAQTNQEAQRKFAQTVNELFLKGTQAKELETFKQKGRLELEAAKTKTQDVGKTIRQLIGGLIPAENVLSPGQIEQAAPLGTPLAGGGVVGTAPGATRNELGNIISPTGQTIGEDPTGKLTRQPGAIGEILGGQLGITPQQATMKEVLGTAGITKKPTEFQLRNTAEAMAARRIPTFQRGTEAGRKKFDALAERFFKELKQKHGVGEGFEESIDVEELNIEEVNF